MVNAIYNEIFGAALALPPELRAMLADHLLKSLDTETQSEIDALWGQAAEARIEDIEQGRVVAIPGEQVLRNLRARHNP